jgi:hypothetical protein
VVRDVITWATDLLISIVNIEVREIRANSKVPPLTSFERVEPTPNIMAVEMDIKGTPTKT